MATTQWPVYSDLAKEHYGKGEEKGQVEDRRDAVFTVVEERGLTLTDAQRELITDCADLASSRSGSERRSPPKRRMTFSGER